MAFVPKLWDNFYLKVGYLVTMLIALDPRGIDLAYPTEFERRSAVRLLFQLMLGIHNKIALLLLQCSELRASRWRYLDKGGKKRVRVRERE